MLGAIDYVHIVMGTKNIIKRSAMHDTCLQPLRSCIIWNGANFDYTYVLFLVPG